MSKSIILAVNQLSFPMKTLDPFLFCVYHKDHYPAGDNLMQAPREGNGADFNPASEYRMYHGDRIPGFPQHPHRGFETLTATVRGIVDHTDSQGNAGRYGQGDLQWMTAGRGVVHGEMFPLVHQDNPNTLQLFQIWLNLPSKDKMVEPAFTMHWYEQIPKYITSDDLSTVTVWAGEYEGLQGLSPTPNSYANSKDADLAVWFLQLKPNAKVNLPPARLANEVNRRFYFVEGHALSINGNSIPAQSMIDVNPSAQLVVENVGGDVVEMLMLQGKPIGEPVAQHGPFVMNTMEEVQQAFADYRRTGFGGWPWSEDAVAFPREKGRFALVNGKEVFPPNTIAEL